MNSKKTQLDIAQLVREIHELKRAVQIRDQKIHELENSLCWRVTSPLRRLGHIFSVQAQHSTLPQIDPGNSVDQDEIPALPSSQAKLKPTILLLDFNLGGGSNLYSRNLIAQMERSGHRVILLEYRYGVGDYHLEYFTAEGIAESFFTSELSEFFPDVLKKFSIDFLAVSQLVSWPDTSKVLDVISLAGTPYLVLMHDHFLLCPNWSLFDYKNKFCGVPDDPSVCALCLEKLRKLDIPLEHHTGVKQIDQWRSSALEFLAAAEKVMCFSDATLQLVKKAYPQLANVVVNEHCIPELPLFSWQQISYNAGKRLTIAVIGEISVAKGSKVLDALINSQEFRKLPVRIVLLGVIHPPPRYTEGEDANFVLHGSYNRADLESLLELYDTSMVMIPSQWPETFCFTASEALLLGYPVLCFDLGAQAERIRRYNCGWIAEKSDLHSTLGIIKVILANPDILSDKSLLARNYIPPSAEHHFSMISEIAANSLKSEV